MAGTANPLFVGSNPTLCSKLKQKTKIGVLLEIGPVQPDCDTFVLYGDVAQR